MSSYSRNSFSSPHAQRQFASVYNQDSPFDAGDRNLSSSAQTTETSPGDQGTLQKCQCKCHSDSYSDSNSDHQRKVGLLEQYVQSATIHGVSQTSGPQFYCLRRSIWLVLILVMAVCLGWTLFGQISHLYAHHIRTVTRVTLKSELPFPAVTICNLNQYIRDRVPDIPIIEELLRQQSQYVSIARDTGLYNKTVDVEKFSDVSGEDLVNIIRHAAPRLQDFLLQCSWSLRRYPCQDLFRPIQTGYGTCFVFNGPEILPENLVSAVSSFSDLRVLIATQNRRSYYSTLIHAGIKVLVHQPDEMPFPRFHGWYVRPGVAASMAVTREESKGLPSPFKAFSNGYCEDTKAEGYVNRLARYKIYSADNCINDCLYEKLEAMCNCKHYFALGNRSYCSAKQILMCYMPGLLNINTGDMAHCGCRRRCDTVSYTADVSYSNFASQFVQEQAVLDGLTLFDDDLRESIIDLKIFFKSLNVMEVVQEPETNMMAIIGTLGGQMGLFLGASILSLTELLELLLLLLLRTIKRLASKKKT